MVVNYYRPLPQNLPAHHTRLGAHTDFGLLSILKDDGNEGLEVQVDPHKSKEFVPVAIPEDCICVNLGDLMELFTNRRYRSTMHRVTLPKDSTKERKALVYVTHFNTSTTVEPHPSQITPERPNCGIKLNAL